MSPLELGRVDHLDAALVVVSDENGHSVGAWTETEGANIRVRAKTYCYDRGWGSVDNLSDDGQDASDVDIALNGARQAVVIWNRSNGVNTIVQAATVIVTMGP